RRLAPGRRTRPQGGPRAGRRRRRTPRQARRHGDRGPGPPDPAHGHPRPLRVRAPGRRGLIRHRAAGHGLHAHAGRPGTYRLTSAFRGAAILAASRAMSYASTPGLPVVDAMTPPVLVLSGPLTPDGVDG